MNYQDKEVLMGADFVVVFFLKSLYFDIKTA